MPDHGLSRRQLDQLRRVLAPYADRLDRVGLFGSRATGAARPESDIDLVLYGCLTQTDIDRLWTLFDDSDLDLKVDVLAYALVDQPRLKAHIDAVTQPLFEHAKL